MASWACCLSARVGWTLLRAARSRWSLICMTFCLGEGGWWRPAMLILSLRPLKVILLPGRAPLANAETTKVTADKTKGSCQLLLFGAKVFDQGLALSRRWLLARLLSSRLVMLFRHQLKVGYKIKPKVGIFHFYEGAKKLSGEIAGQFARQWQSPCHVPSRNNCRTNWDFCRNASYI